MNYNKLVKIWCNELICLKEKRIDVLEKEREKIENEMGDLESENRFLDMLRYDVSKDKIKIDIDDEFDRDWENNNG